VADFEVNRKSWPESAEKNNTDSIPLTHGPSLSLPLPPTDSYQLPPSNNKTDHNWQYNAVLSFFPHRSFSIGALGLGSCFSMGALGLGSCFSMGALGLGSCFSMGALGLMFSADKTASMSQTNVTSSSACIALSSAYKISRSWAQAGCTLVSCTPGMLWTGARFGTLWTSHRGHQRCPTAPSTTPAASSASTAATR
jgi:hypothetical protein